MSKTKNDAENGLILPQEEFSDPAVDAQLENIYLLESLSTVPEFENQVEAFVELMTPDPQTIKCIYDSIEQDLASVLSTIFVQPFIIRSVGSRVSGLQFNSSDIDMNVHFESSRPDKARNCLVKIAEALFETGIFHSVRDVCRARIPIVKCVHKETGLKCDINISFLSGVENSQLMQNFLSVDTRLRLVMLVIKYWAQIHEFTGVELGFSKYSLVMMYIFYLQQCHAFPSVHDLQEDTVATNRHVKWNMNFSALPDSTIMSGISMLDLLTRFFDHYANFDYSTMIICPYFGKPIAKKDFSNYSFLLRNFTRHTKHLKLIKRMRVKVSICIQDPLELDRNTCSVSQFNLSRFISQCSTAYEVLSRCKSYMLIELLSPLEKLCSYFKVCLRMTTCSVENLKAKHVFASYNELTDMWFKRTLDFCNIVFQRIFKLKIDSEGHFKANHSYSVSSIRQTWLWRSFDAEKIEEQLARGKLELEGEMEIRDSPIPTDNIPATTPEFKCAILISNCEKNPFY